MSTHLPVTAFGGPSDGAPTYRFGPFLMWGVVGIPEGGITRTVLVWVVRGPYVKDLPPRFRRLGGRWVPTERVWVFPREAERRLKRLLEEVSSRFETETWSSRQRNFVEDILYRRLPEAFVEGDDVRYRDLLDRLRSFRADRHPDTGKSFRLAEELSRFLWTNRALLRRYRIREEPFYMVWRLHRDLLRHVRDVSSVLKRHRGDRFAAEVAKRVADTVRYERSLIRRMLSEYAKALGDPRHPQHEYAVRAEKLRREGRIGEIVNFAIEDVFRQAGEDLKKAGFGSWYRDRS